MPDIKLDASVCKKRFKIRFLSGRLSLFSIYCVSLLIIKCKAQTGRLLSGYTYVPKMLNYSVLSFKNQLN